MYFGVVGGEAQLRLPYVHLKKRKEKNGIQIFMLDLGLGQQPRFWSQAWSQLQGGP